MSIGARGLSVVTPSVWPYLLLAAAAAAVLVTQRAFREARLDWTLPPIATTQPIVAVVLGVLLLHDRLSVPCALAVESACLVAAVFSTILIGRSPALAESDIDRKPGQAGTR